MFTGRLTIAISCSRSGTSSGAMSRSSSLSGREWTPGTKKPVEVEVVEDPCADQRQIEIAVPGPSASNGAPSFQREPVTALPRRTTPVFSGITSLMSSTKRRASPGLAEREADDVVALLRLGQFLFGCTCFSHTRDRRKPAANARPVFAQRDRGRRARRAPGREGACGERPDRHEPAGRAERQRIARLQPVEQRSRPAGRDERQRRAGDHAAPQQAAGLADHQADHPRAWRRAPSGCRSPRRRVTV